MSSLLWWNDWMCICSYGSKKVGVSICLRRVIVSSMLPCSCLQLTISSAYAEQGSLFLMYCMCSRNLEQIYSYIFRIFEQITSLLKNTNIGISFKSATTLHHPIKRTAPTRLQEHEKSGIYKITYKTCHKVYVGQTGRNLKSNFVHQVG